MVPTEENRGVVGNPRCAGAVAIGWIGDATMVGVIGADGVQLVCGWCPGDGCPVGVPVGCWGTAMAAGATGRFDGAIMAE